MISVVCYIYLVLVLIVLPHSSFPINCFITREASVANARGEFVVSYESILGMPANDVRPFVRQLSTKNKHFIFFLYFFN